jgi:hypothetical protein
MHITVTRGPSARATCGVGAIADTWQVQKQFYERCFDGKTQVVIKKQQKRESGN